jgi:hypothetical protein
MYPVTKLERRRRGLDGEREDNGYRICFVVDWELYVSHLYCSRDCHVQDEKVPEQEPELDLIGSRSLYQS